MLGFFCGAARFFIFALSMRRCDPGFCRTMNTSYFERSAPRDGTCAAKQLKILRGQPWHGLALAIISILVMAGSGCKIAPPAPKPERTIHPREDVAATHQQIRLRMRALVEPLSGAIIESADRIIAGTTNRSVQRQALLWKIEAVPALREALFRPGPFVAIMDTWVLMWQMTDYFESGRGQKALGAAAPIAVKTCQELATEIETIAASFVKSGDVSGARKFARQWAREHPIQYSIDSRESILSRVIERKLKEAFSAQEMAGSVLVTLDDLSRRMDVYSAQFFNQARWQAELVARELADEYDLEKAMPLAETAVQSATEAVAVLKRLEPAVDDTLAVAKSTPEIISRERIAALKYVTKEREAALAELRQTIVTEREVMMADAERISQKVVDHAMLRLTQLTVAVLVFLFVGVVVLLFIIRRIFATRLGG
jgi:hypothetical protein